MNDNIIYMRRARLIAGIGGGTPLNLTRPAMTKILDYIIPLDVNWQGVVVGHGDGLVPAMMYARPHNIGVGGVEWLVDLDSGYLSKSAAKMFGKPEPPKTLCWGTDVMSLSSLSPLLGANGDIPIIAYGFDDSIPPDARLHWYKLLETNRNVISVATTMYHGFDMSELLPSFVETNKFPVNMEGGRCRRTMLIFKRPWAFN